MKPKPRQSLDGCRRKRLWLMRHADVSYLNEDGTPVSDPRQVPLTEFGVETAKMTAQMLADVGFDRAICSGLPRTVQTARLVLAGRSDSPQLEMHPALEEIRGFGNARRKGSPPPVTYDPTQTAYSFWNAGHPDIDFFWGESFEQAAQRCQQAIGNLLCQAKGNSLLAVCHGGINRLILSWAINAPLTCMAPFEQDPCCVNILDFDLDESSTTIRRATLRGVNISARDGIKLHRDLTTLEETAVQIAAALRAANSPAQP